MMERLANTPPIVAGDDDVVMETSDENCGTNNQEKCMAVVIQIQCILTILLFYFIQVFNNFVEVDSWNTSL